MNANPGMWVDVDGNFYRVAFGDEPATEEEEQESSWKRTRRMLTAFTRRATTMIRRTHNTSSLSSAFSTEDMQALVDVFAILNNWYEEKKR